MYKTIDDVVEAELWPVNRKPLTDLPGDERIEKLGFKLFYKGKNADLYFIPGKIAMMLMVRTDRTSVFNIKTDLIIEGKGAIQNKISLLSDKFVKDFGLRTSVMEMLSEIPEEIAERSQVVEICKPLEMTYKGKKVGLELIWRNFLTGSLYGSHYTKDSDPYGLNLEPGLKEWHEFDTPIFTPTLKNDDDDPILASLVLNMFPGICKRLNELFITYTKYAKSKGIVIVDTKLEVFINSKDEWVLGDEILTPESSRFIRIEDFIKKIYASMDKQTIRNFGEEQLWKEKAKSLEPGEILKVFVLEKVKQKVIDDYHEVFDKLAA